MGKSTDRDNRMRLLYINYEFPPLGGGGGRANEQIARQMASLGHQVVVMTSAYQSLPRKEIKDGYLVLRIPTLRRYVEKCRIFEMVAFMFSAIFYSIKWVRKQRPDMTIAFFTLPSAPAALILKKLFRIPYIVSLHGGDVPGFMREQLRIYHSLTIHLIRYIWREAHAVVTISQGLKELALKTHRKVKISIIPNGVDAPFFQEVAPMAPVASSRPFRILTVGRLSPQKRMDILLEAVAMLKTQNPSCPVQLWIVGDGPLRTKLEEQAKALGIAADVSFFGWQNQENLRNFYSSADIFVLSSAYEGMPLVLLEAMAAGLPVVASKVSGTEEVIRHGENGFLVPTCNSRILSEKITTLIFDDRLRETFSKASLASVGRYNWRDAAASYLELCRTGA